MFCPTLDRPAGHTVTQVTANDVDLSSTITYSLSAKGSTRSPFAIDQYTGVVTLTQALDYEEQAEYTLAVLASDSLHQTSGEVKVQVLDVNDNAPVFSKDSYQVKVPQSSVPKPGQIDGQMQADACDLFCLKGGFVGVGGHRHASSVCFRHRQRLWTQRRDHLHTAVVSVTRLLHTGGQW